MTETRPAQYSHIKKAGDLVTSYEETRAGFVALALERNRRATPYVAEARAVKSMAEKARTPRDLIRNTDIAIALLTASGISDKAAGHLTDEIKKVTIQTFVDKYLEPAGDKFVEELVFRYLLTRGDTLGGSMRNVGGALAQTRLCRCILAAISLTRSDFHWYHQKGKKWIVGSADDADIEYELSGISWTNSAGNRTLLFNVKVPQVQNNVDVVLLKGDIKSASRIDILSDKKNYLALGELKGGVDPAGADEHWKTARTALLRIQKAFGTSSKSPGTFFVGAAIEKRMATEIWALLKSSKLSNAANLTVDKHTTSLCNWLIRL